jgi:thioredoxin-related protein
MSSLVKYFMRGALIGALLIIIAPQTRAAELVMFEQAGCAWCQTFDREIAPIYGKTTEGLRAPLRRVDIDGVLPADLAFIQVERLTPLFVLTDKGREIGRIRGYPGDDNFWGLLGALIKQLDQTGTSGEHRLPYQKTARAAD